jgi:hypothetical protein
MKTFATPLSPWAKADQKKKKLAKEIKTAKNFLRDNGHVVLTIDEYGKICQDHHQIIEKKNRQINYLSYSLIFLAICCLCVSVFSLIS